MKIPEDCEPIFAEINPLKDLEEAIKKLDLTMAMLIYYLWFYKGDENER